MVIKHYNRQSLIRESHKAISGFVKTRMEPAVWSEMATSMSWRGDHTLDVSSLRVVDHCRSILCLRSSAWEGATHKGETLLTSPFSATNKCQAQEQALGHSRWAWETQVWLSGAPPYWRKTGIKETISNYSILFMLSVMYEYRVKWVHDLAINLRGEQKVLHGSLWLYWDLTNESKRDKQKTEVPPSKHKRCLSHDKQGNSYPKSLFFFLPHYFFWLYFLGTFF